MQNKKKIQVFNDGIMALYSISDDDSLSLIMPGIRFELRTVGSKRFFEAMEQQHRADKVIRIPKYAPETNANTVVLIEGRQYTVLQTQDISDTAPECRQLTLEELKEVNYHDIH